MKFCYLDESGTGSEPYSIMAGIIVDSQRMHITKNDWKNLLSYLSQIINRKVIEFHTRDFYSGNGIWRGIDGQKRSIIINAILKWIIDRKHKISFSGLNKKLYFSEKDNNVKLKELHSQWCFLGLHQMLILQKHYQREAKNKGNTVVIFDHEVKEETRFSELILNPPEWTFSYYDKNRDQEPFDQIIDVPYYSDSENVSLIQVADLVAYILRLYAELKEKHRKEAYTGELSRINEWIKYILKASLPKTSRYLARGRDDCSELFYKYSPQSIREL